MKNSNPQHSNSQHGSDNGHASANGHASPNGEANGSAHETNDPAHGHAAANTATVLEQAHALRGVLRDALSKTNELVSSIKRNKRQSRLVESTLASLRQLQSIDA